MSARTTSGGEGEGELGAIFAMTTIGGCCGQGDLLLGLRHHGVDEE